MTRDQLAKVLQSWPYVSRSLAALCAARGLEAVLVLQGVAQIWEQQALGRPKEERPRQMPWNRLNASSSSKVS